MKNSSKWIYYWLISGVILISLMVVVGGITRLTHSGLSIVEWKPITGIIPPLTESEWTIEFQKYFLLGVFTSIISEINWYFIYCPIYSF